MKHLGKKIVTVSCVPPATSVDKAETSTSVAKTITSTEEKVEPRLGAMTLPKQSHQSVRVRPRQVLQLFEK